MNLKQKSTKRKIFSRYNFRNKRNHKRLVRTSLVFGNFLIVGFVVFLIVNNAGGNAANYSALTTAEESRAANPLDVMSASDVAVNVALMAKLPESGLVINDADTVTAELSSNSVIARETVVKPQILSTEIKTKEDIQEYVVVEGDTFESLAEKFGVTSDSIKWSNGIVGSRLVVGKKLVIPPVNGIVHVVKEGDNAESLAGKYNASKEAITSFNDAELTGLVAGDKIVIPNGSITVATVAVSRPYYAGFAFGNSAVYGYNGYVPGYCTYYAASRVSVPANWGNARAWASGARMTPGWNVSKTPVVGAVAQTTRMHYLGHVAVVEAVSEDGSQIKISDMNGVAGFNRVGYSDWISVGTYDWFIYR